MVAAAAASGALLLLALDGSGGSALGWRLLALLLLVARRLHGVAQGAGLADNVVWAVNAGGEAHVDFHGIHFWKDPLRTGGASEAPLVALDVLKGLIAGGRFCQEKLLTERPPRVGLHRKA
ncbi:hypothetical protein JRQ81_006368 [Phrynocephalus forsythii]|uniref:Uncharacterized protein n=1 Tax=Phrynocephalus forsythii TaxID=171643 RepID=A0A9Q0Y5N3_9SAUR|nr:hypothetical protein JRQ81_006368 [Phrynocephalus forsythii]